MTMEQCLICHSQDGIFLNINDHPTLVSKAKNCRLNKVLIKETTITKVCHKCAFEIEQCNAFIEKVKKSYRAHKSSKNCCGVCLDSYKKEYFFDLSEHRTGLDDLIKNIQTLFSADEIKVRKFQENLICLSCRYCIDLLNDLRFLCDNKSDRFEVIHNGIYSDNILQIKTSIINRRTVDQTTNLNLNTPSDTESESSIMASKKRAKNNVKTSLKSHKKCTKCKTPEIPGNSMYKIFRTGLTYCKTCWLTIDHAKTSSKKRIKVNYPDTKLCSVLVHDLYEVTTEDEKEFVIEKNEDGNTIFRTKKSTSKKQKGSKVIETKVDKSRKSNRKNSEQNSEIPEDANIKLTKNNLQNLEPSAEEEILIKPTKTTRNRKDSELSVQESVKSERSTRKRKDSEQSLQESVKSDIPIRRRKDSEQSIKEQIIHGSKRPKRTRNNSEQSITENIPKQSTKTTRKRKESEQSLEDEIVDVDADSDTGIVSKKQKTKSIPKQNLKSNKNNQNSVIERTTRSKRDRSSSVESSCSVRKSARNNKRKLQELEEIVEIDDEDETLKVQKESISEDKEVTLKKKKLNKTTLGNEESETESNSSIKNDVCKESSPGSEFEISQKSNAKSDASDSEEIDVLKSTDDDSKMEDSLEKISEIKDNILKSEEETIFDNSNTSPKHIEKNKSKSDDNPSAENATDFESKMNDAEDVEDIVLESASIVTFTEKLSPKSVKSRKLKSNKKKVNKKVEVVFHDSSESQITESNEPAVLNYSCRVCDKLFENKFIGLQHELTHMKSLEIKLQKVESSEKTEHDDSDDKLGDLENEVPCSNVIINDQQKVIEQEMRVQDEIDDEETVEKVYSSNNEKIDESKGDESDMENQEGESYLNKNIEKSSKELLQHNDNDNDDDLSNPEKIESEKLDRRSRSRHTSRKSEEKSPKKLDEKSPKKPEKTSPHKSDEKLLGQSQDNMEATNNDTESQTIDTNSDNIAEAVQETLDDIAHLHEKNQSSSEDAIDIDDASNSSVNKNIETIVERDSEDEAEISPPGLEEENNVEENEDEAQPIVDKDSDIDETSQNLNDDQEVIECETIEEDAQTISPIVDEDHESKDVVDIEAEGTHEAEESEVEITEVEDDEIINPADTACEQIDLTENDDYEAPKLDDGAEVEEVVDSSETVHIDENTGDSVSEINITSADEPCMENEEGNLKQNNSLESNNEENETTDNTEDELAQASLEDLLQRKGLQIVDELPDSVTEGDESEKESNENDSHNCSNVSKKDLNMTTESEFQLKMSESECTEILESNKSKSKDTDDGIIGECQIIQDVDVVEEVINSDENPGEVEEVEAESNGNCLNVTNHDKGGAHIFHNLQTEPISDDETNLHTQTLENLTRVARNSHDMPSLDPICEDIDDD